MIYEKVCSEQYVNTIVAGLCIFSTGHCIGIHNRKSGAHIVSFFFFCEWTAYGNMKYKNVHKLSLYFIAFTDKNLDTM
jgi:hypothetical protein